MFGGIVIGWLFLILLAGAADALLLALKSTALALAVLLSLVFMLGGLGMMFNKQGEFMKRRTILLGIVSIPVALILLGISTCTPWIQFSSGGVFTAVAAIHALVWVRNACRRQLNPFSFISADLILLAIGFYWVIDGAYGVGLLKHPQSVMVHDSGWWLWEKTHWETVDQHPSWTWLTHVLRDVAYWMLLLSPVALVLEVVVRKHALVRDLALKARASLATTWNS